MSDDNIGFDYRGLQILKVSESRIQNYIMLFRETFPNFNPSNEYLRWLYYENPLGDVIGFDALDGQVVVAHYVCIPTKVNNFEGLSLLALNTATHPSYQARGLLKILALETFKEAGNNFAGIFGVANGNVLNALTRHLGFIHLGFLELRFGWLRRQGLGQRVYSESEIRWRTKSPGRKIKSYKIGQGTYLIKTFRFGKLFPIKSIVHSDGYLEEEGRCGVFNKFGITLDWRRDFKPRIFLPSFLKPSPLALVYRPLAQSEYSRLSSWSFPDFDAF